MKKLLTMFLLSPVVVFAQSDSSMFSGGLISFIISFLFALVVFLIIRGVMLWYWRVNDIIKRQDTQIELLQSIVRRLEERNINDTTINNSDGPRV